MRQARSEQRLDPAVGTLLNLGDCHEKSGRIATAWTTFRAAASLAETRQDLKRAEFSRKRATALEPHLPTITIRVLGTDPRLVVKRDGIVIEEVARATPLPVDPGPHVIYASARGRLPFSTTGTTASGTPTVADAPVLAVDPDAPVEPSDSAPCALPGDGKVLGVSKSTLRIVGIASGAVGLLALGAGTAFALKAKSQWSDAESSHCDAARTCDDIGFALNEDARSSGNIATIAVVSGAVLLAAGAALYFITRKDLPKKAGATAVSANIIRFALP